MAVSKLKTRKINGNIYLDDGSEVIGGQGIYQSLVFESASSTSFTDNYIGVYPIRDSQRYSNRVG